MERTAIVQAFQACGACAPVPPTLAAAGLGSLRFGCAEAAVSQAARLILRRRPVKDFRGISSASPAVFHESLTGRRRKPVNRL